MTVIAGAAALIIIALLVALASGLTSARPSDPAPLLAIGAAGLLVLVVVAVAFAGVGLGGGGHEDGAAPAAIETTTTTAVTSASVVTTTTSLPSHGAVDAREIAMHANVSEGFGGMLSVVDRLSSPAVLLVSASGFEPGATGLIEQCTAQGCGNPFPVTFGDLGVARLQYLVDAEVGTGPGEVASCRADDPPCVVRVRSGSRAAFAATVFGGATPPPREVSVEAPAGGIADGAPVMVAVTGFTPGERVQAMLCAAPATFGTARCGAPGPVAPLSIADDGTGRTSLAVRRGRVGTDGVVCGRDAPCGVVVASAGTSVPGPVVPIKFATGPNADYDATRLLVGLLVAAVLFALAAFLVRTTDWRKPTEADTPELDGAIL